MKVINQNLTLRTKWVSGVVLRNVTGWAFLAAAVGALIEAVIPKPPGEGTIGLIPLYLGVPIGAIGLVLILRRTEGWAAAISAAVGFAGFIYFMGTYPDHPEGWIGLILVGVAHLFVPIPGRFASVLWIASGILAFPAFHARDWGVVNGWTLMIAATAASGIFVLQGRKPENRD